MRVTAEALPGNPAEELGYAIDTDHTESAWELQRRVTAIRQVLGTLSRGREAVWWQAMEGFLEEEACTSLILKDGSDLNI